MEFLLNITALPFGVSFQFSKWYFLSFSLSLHIRNTKDTNGKTRWEFFVSFRSHIVHDTHVWLTSKSCVSDSADRHDSSSGGAQVQTLDSCLIFAVVTLLVTTAITTATDDGSVAFDGWTGLPLTSSGTNRPGTGSNTVQCVLSVLTDPIVVVCLPLELGLH